MRADDLTKFERAINRFPSEKYQIYFTNGNLIVVPKDAYDSFDNFNDIRVEHARKVISAPFIHDV